MLERGSARLGQCSQSVKRPGEESVVSNTAVAAAAAATKGKHNQRWELKPVEGGNKG